MADPHLRAREMFVPVQVGGVTVEVFGSPMKLSATPPRVAGEAPTPGQHSRDVYVGWLGLPVERFESLRASGVI